jgi:hypothetical protein
MATWLKLIGSAQKPITDPPFHGNYTDENVGFRRPGKPKIRAGDHLFLYAPGGSRRIFALAEAVGDPELDSNHNPQEEGSCRWKLRVHYIRNLPVASGILIDEIIYSQRDLTRSIRQAGHIKLLPEETELAYRKLGEKATE